uniref:Uncharacterized protein n=1 Tax=Arundo donax TaxID=35708 RepID=A0A0A9B8F8_ARUDO
MSRNPSLQERNQHGKARTYLGFLFKTTVDGSL